jgi:nitrogen fixation/metabolism regulation signal transduction histidine kinase
VDPRAGLGHVVVDKIIEQDVPEMELRDTRKEHVKDDKISIKFE